LSVDFELRPFFAGGGDGGDAFGGYCFGLATLFFFFGGVGEGGDAFGGYCFGVTFLFCFFGGGGDGDEAFGGYCFGVATLFCLAEVFFYDSSGLAWVFFLLFSTSSEGFFFSDFFGILMIKLKRDQ
jgi:hypothetical protein